MKVSMILAASENNVIGNKGDLPWHIPTDLKYFKSTTKNHVIVMGRKTFESLLKFSGKPLPSRTHVVITRNSEYKVPEGVHVVGSIAEGIDKAKELGETECFIIGGGEIYKQAMEIADNIYLTRIFAEYEGDTFFPEIDPNVWELNSGKTYPKTGKDSVGFAFLVYGKKK